MWAKAGTHSPRGDSEHLCKLSVAQSTKQFTVTRSRNSCALVT
ncbi:hypothetical protein BH09ACT7_BH09ACT7_50350 [soil metagenome]